MLTCSLQSGSNGNCIYVEAGDVRLLFDAGISGRQVQQRLGVHQRSPRGCTALIISHDHGDHSACAGALHRRFGMPVYMAPRVWRAVRNNVGPIPDLHLYSPGNTLTFGDVSVHTIPTPHDGIDTACFVIEHEKRRLGIFTDLGHPFAELSQALGEIDAAYLESNFDVDMLWNGQYPEAIKRRIAGDGGHLSNADAAALMGKALSREVRWLALAHLSAENNTPELALETGRRGVGRLLELHIASRYEASDLRSV
ncbi:putative metallo-hydrolase YycJ [Phycisphaerae bacterium RAS1]|nr:putative metallo-hydrolase YycJ [Phycisphaerae bacterium RAS1]